MLKIDVLAIILAWYSNKRIKTKNIKSFYEKIEKYRKSYYYLIKKTVKIFYKDAFKARFKI